VSRLPLLRIGYDDAPEISSAIEDLRTATVLLDVEPLVCLWNSGDDELAAGLTLMLERIVAVPSLRAAVFITNSRRVPSIPLHNSRLAVSYLHSARKPWLSLEHFRVLPRPVAVVGDQPLTDGLLAWRLRAPFVQLGLPEQTPPGIRLQAKLGGAVLRTLFASA
jgi:predicted HAD superfamily phosphohydrolase YqeG